ncbi:hypothetical protein NDU88_003745 [Pleurodeles waltl]|uniref:Uncharacterized protein n=1 Tax=Pleurodeles waltl TaxID=8319 RepID=A0AAV7W8D5_PLEWA|nr:hypothetical protein NDU88_003745 [Pleurodeles waltl]
MLCRVHLQRSGSSSSAVYIRVSGLLLNICIRVSFPVVMATHELYDELALAELFNKEVLKKSRGTPRMKHVLTDKQVIIEGFGLERHMLIYGISSGII